ncbi:MAG: nitrite reductase/ring-hydroxylating ferredoxin subunit [Bradymonadia bacterium]|jgi:nitrite reductase/ring-hydroxylating ferredoxin subunit
MSLPPFPDGWYAVGLSDELPRNAMITRTFCGDEVVIFRKSDGDLAAVDAYCPHLGAHMGKGGHIKEDTLVCPFHAFRFDGDGKCVATGYGTKPPPKALLKTWPVLDLNGLVMLYHDGEGALPAWEPPKMGWEDWTPLQAHRLEAESHPQETTENSVDLGHLSVVHGYEAVDILEPLEVDGPYLTAKYTMTRVNPWLKALPAIVTSFRVHVWGLGYSMVEIYTQNFDFNFRLFILPMPIDGERVAIRIAVSVRKDCAPANISPALALLPRSFFLRFLRKATLDGVANDVRQDFDIWQHKKYVQPPLLVKGDGPIGPYRRYCRQFYPEFRTGSRGAATVS